MNQGPGGLDDDALPFATEAPHAALWRHLHARLESSLSEVYAFAADTVRWVCAIDEQARTPHEPGTASAYGMDLGLMSRDVGPRT